MLSGMGFLLSPIPTGDHVASFHGQEAGLRRGPPAGQPSLTVSGAGWTDVPDHPLHVLGPAAAPDGPRVLPDVDKDPVGQAVEPRGLGAGLRPGHFRPPRGRTARGSA